MARRSSASALECRGPRCGLVGVAAAWAGESRRAPHHLSRGSVPRGWCHRPAGTPPGAVLTAGVARGARSAWTKEGMPLLVAATRWMSYGGHVQVGFAPALPRQGVGSRTYRDAADDRKAGPDQRIVTQRMQVWSRWW